MGAKQTIRSSRGQLGWQAACSPVFLWAFFRLPVSMALIIPFLYPLPEYDWTTEQFQPEWVPSFLILFYTISILVSLHYQGCKSLVIEKLSPSCTQDSPLQSTRQALKGWRSKKADTETNQIDKEKFAIYLANPNSANLSYFSRRKIVCKAFEDVLSMGFCFYLLPC